MRDLVTYTGDFNDAALAITELSIANHRRRAHDAENVLLLIRATLALYDTVGAYGYQRREGKIATFPF